MYGDDPLDYLLFDISSNLRYNRIYLQRRVAMLKIAYCDDMEKDRDNADAY